MTMTTRTQATKKLGFHRSYAFWIGVLVLMILAGKVIEAFVR